MSDRFTLFEVSWEVCNKVGGIHTVLSTKAKSLVERLGDDYVCVGPWLLSESDAGLPFDDEPGFEAFVDECRVLGVPVRVGRWRIPGTPRTLLVSFSDLYPRRDAILTELWMRAGVDSLGSHWDYIEPVMFGHAAGIAVQHWWRTYRRGLDSRAVAQCHEWLTGSALLHLAAAEPTIGTVFTTHATVLGRAASAHEVALDEAPPEALADRLQVRSKHSLESVTARESDVFTTVSTLTADEASRALGRAPHPILPNGIDLDVSDALVGGVQRTAARVALRRLAERFLGTPVDDAALLGISGRYEFRNKGIDVLLDALGALNRRPGRAIVLFVLVPAGNSGPKVELLQRLADDAAPANGPIGLSTHNLFDPNGDPVHQRCAALGLGNAVSDRVRIVQIPIYLRADDELLGLSYEAALQGLDLTCFPSAYEPWGYTPQESLVAGVPTITTDLAGFGRWCQDNGVTPADGVTVVPREGRSDGEVAADLASVIEAFVEAYGDHDAHVEACRRTASRVSWSDLLSCYDEAFAAALARAEERQRSAPPAFGTSVAVPTREDGEGARPRLMVFDVSARLPETLSDLARLAHNYWWTTDVDAAALFASLAPDAWATSGHDPVRLLRRIDPESLRERALDPAFLAALRDVTSRFDAYLSAPARAPDGWPEGRPVAYFSLEFGVHESLPIYSGGLGVLAGDHLKSASDLGLPLLGVGLFYHMGYFGQRVTQAGDQVAADVPLAPLQMPLELVRDEEGQALEIVVRLPGGRMHVQAWRAMVGRVPLLLLDANLPHNRPEERAVTRNLYSADQDLRLRQEILLGKGGVRLLRALGIRPTLYHLNEGHAALTTLERVADLVRREGLTFDEAFALVRATTVFTTHTPVAAGHDRFGIDLMRRYFSDAPNWIGVPWERFFALGLRPGEPDTFNMTGLAIRASSVCNAVSDLHRRVSQDLLAPFWPRHLVDEVPIDGVTNGVHLASWVHPAVARLVRATPGPVTGQDYAASAARLEDAALWRARTEARRELLAAARAHLQRRFVERRDSPRLMNAIQDGLDDEALTIGFARRFAPYKRADLLFKDRDRLAELLGDPRRPVRVLYAGKAHPNDNTGKEILQRVVALSRDPRFAGKVIFLEDHDIALARRLVQGCDVWLNTPRHLLEASGTSGMKAAANGSLNVSILDGWWAEAFDAENGWAIGGERVYEDDELQDELDSTLLYELLEEQIVPAFFDRDAEGLPRAWLARVKRSLATIPPVYNTDRMVAAYRDRIYSRCAADRLRLESNRFADLRRATAQEERLRILFPRVRILDARIGDLRHVQVGDAMQARVVVELGELATADVRVELVVGRPVGDRYLDEAEVVPMSPAGRVASGTYAFEGSHIVKRAGPLAYGLRVRAAGDPSLAGAEDLLLWA